jgi:hypothetical protein
MLPSRVLKVVGAFQQIGTAPLPFTTSVITLDAVLPVTLNLRTFSGSRGVWPLQAVKPAPTNGMNAALIVAPGPATIVPMLPPELVIGAVVQDWVGGHVIVVDVFVVASKVLVIWQLALSPAARTRLLPSSEPPMHDHALAW